MELMQIATNILDRVKNDGPWRDYPGDQGKGIVICGGGIYAPSTYVAIRHLRARGCNLPIQVWALDSAETSPNWRKLITSIGGDIEIKYSVLHCQDYQLARGYECKIIALMNCPWRHVLLLDADNVALRNPAYLFDSVEYQEYGQIFWPDQDFKNKEIWTIKDVAFEHLQIPYQQGLELETGQILIDREKCWKEMQLTEFLNQHSPEVYKHYSWGDKDTFVLAWRALKTKYYVVPKRPLYPLHGLLMHYGTRGEPMFLHQRKFLESPHRMAEIMAQEEYFRKDSLQYLNDYYEVIPWNGAMSVPGFYPIG